jgi:hypothetical protein
MSEKELNDPSRFRQASRSTDMEVDYRKAMEQYIETGVGTYNEKLENFSKYVSRQTTARYIALYEIFKLILNVQGDVIEGGVNWGGGLMWFAQLSASMEPINFQRRIIGFDTFSGFADISVKDSKSSQNTEMKKGGFAADSYEDLLHNIELFDKNRFVNHIPKVVLVKGDVAQTIPKFLDENPQQIISLLHLDFDLYEPTKTALVNFLPKMSKGSVIIFDELNNLNWPGETTAVLESLNLSNVEIKRFSFEPHVSYAIL